MVLTPFAEVSPQDVAEVRREAIVLVYFAVAADIDRFCLESGRFFGGDEMIGGHPVDDDIAAVGGGFYIGTGVEKTRVVDHSDECGCFVDAEAVGFFPEESAGRPADAVYVVAKGHVIQVKGEDLFLGKIAFQLYGDDPFLEFLDHAAYPVMGSFAVEHIEGQLLCNGAAASVLAEEEDGAEHGLGVDA